jgi:agmatine deiminase
MTQVSNDAIFDALANGYRFPGEFETHDSTWMAWPRRRGLWGLEFEKAKDGYARLAAAINRYEPVYMVAHPEDAADVRTRVSPGISVVALPIDDSWSRDTGPVFLVGRDQALLATGWNFNGWGGKYPPYEADNRLARAIAGFLGVPFENSLITAEGGGFLSDGEGTLYVSETCVLNSNRNPTLGKREAERELSRLLGAQKIVWLPGDRLETGTDGHIDGFFALAGPARGLLEVTPDTTDPRFEILSENRRALELATDARGRRIEFLEIPELPREAAPGEGYCRSYVNFYIGNSAVFFPTYDHPLDAPALDAARRAFPDREICPIPLGAIALGGGGFHCITQQVPRARIPGSAGVNGSAYR